MFCVNLGTCYNGILVPVRTSFGLCRRSGKNVQCMVDVDMLNTVKSVLDLHIAITDLRKETC